MSKTMPLEDDLKLSLLQKCWEPPDTYNFKFDATGKRVFRCPWLEQYKPWLAYSKSQKGAVCRYCVLFPQPVTRGLQGAFIVKPFTNYKDFHDSARSHANCEWHKASHEAATNFINTVTGKTLPVSQQVNVHEAAAIAANREKLEPIVSSVVFCATHDIALRGKTDESSNFNHLMQLRVDAGDKVLANHLATAPANARYTSHETQNEIIDMCGALIREDIVRDANASDEFAILADETTDISGTEQMSLGVRFTETKCGMPYVREEFLGFVPVEDRTAEGIASQILSVCEEYGLNLDKLIGQGYDGCSAMAGKEGGVQAIIRRQYPKALFVHCSSHRLNLVINDVNKVSEVRNVVGTVKAIIHFFRESSQRRKLIPNVPMLCETRWTHKYRSIRLFAENFVNIVEMLTCLSTTAAVKKTRDTTFQLLCAARTPSFLITLHTIKKYSALFEPTTQALQAVQLDLLGVQTHIRELLTVIRKHREDAAYSFKTIFDQAGLQPTHWT